MKTKNKSKLLLVSAFLIWGSIGIFVKLIPFGSGVVALDRSLVGMLFLLCVKLISRQKFDVAALRRDLIVLLINGALLGVNWILLFESYNYTTVATSTICYNIGPMIVVMVSPIIFKERLTLMRVICAITALLGVTCVSGVFENTGVTREQLWGVALGVFAAVVYAVTVIFNKRLDKINPLDKAIVQFFSSTVVMFIYCLFTSELSELVFTLRTTILLLIVGVVHTGVAYLLYFKSLPHVTSQSVAIFAYIDPVVAVLLSAVVLSEQLTFYTIVGAVLVIVSAVSCELYDSKQNRPTNTL